MAFGCPICSERLDRPPCHQAAEARDVVTSVACSPCGHVFHTFCIQKWLTGTVGSNNASCPCCRKVVPGKRVLPLFLTDYNADLDTSFEAEGSGSGGGHCDHSHLTDQLRTLKERVETLQKKLQESDDVVVIQKESLKDLQKKYNTEKLRSDSFQFQWKQMESYKCYAEQKERECDEANAALKQYQIVEMSINRIQDKVLDDLQKYTPTAANLKRILEIHHVITNEYDKASNKLEDAEKKQEKDRLQIARLQKQVKELQQLSTSNRHESSQMSTRRTIPTPTSNKKLKDSLIDLNTSLEYERSDDSFSRVTKNFNPSGSGPSSSSTYAISGNNLPEVDDDVPLIKPFRKKKSTPVKKKAVSEDVSDSVSRKRLKPSKQTSSQSSQSQLDDDFDTDFPLRGSLPGVKIFR